MAYDLYVITDRRIARGLPHAEIARLVIAGGADVVQLRDKGLPCRDLFAAACEIREITREAGVLFIVNDRIDIAIASGADGVHLGQDDLPLRDARRIAPAGFIIGISVGCVADAIAAESCRGRVRCGEPDLPDNIEGGCRAGPWDRSTSRDLFCGIPSRDCNRGDFTPECAAGHCSRR